MIRQISSAAHYKRRFSALLVMVIHGSITFPPHFSLNNVIKIAKKPNLEMKAILSLRKIVITVQKLIYYGAVINLS